MLVIIIIIIIIIIIDIYIQCHQTSIYLQQ